MLVQLIVNLQQFVLIAKQARLALLSFTPVQSYLLLLKLPLDFTSQLKQLAN